MGQRLDLDTLLKGILGGDAVYFQPPSSTTMQYPCIVYNRDTAETAYADNKPYRFTFKYQVTLISKSPNTEETLKKIAALPTCIHDRFFRINNLNHDVFNLYF